MMTLVEIVLVFLFIGAFTYGGGVASLPLMLQQAVSHHWVTKSEFFNMVAVSQSTPGAVGFHMATFIGYSAGGVPGSFLATAAAVIPSLVVTTLIARFFPAFQNLKIINAAFYGLRAAVIGLIASAAYNILLITVINTKAYTGIQTIYKVFDWKGILLFAIAFFLFEKFKKHPVFYIIGGAICGIVFL